MDSTILNHLPLAQIRGLFILIRPKQWIKNGFVLAPLIFTGEFLNTSSICHALFAALLFCIASSATYSLNDIHDINHDRRHRQKCKTRPLASGLITIRQAGFVIVCLYSILIWSWFITPSVVTIIAAYTALNITYTLFLKHQPVLDIFTIATGFVFRVYCGAIALNVPMSSWMFITTLCLALYLAALKRRQELSQIGLDGRQVLERYSVPLMERYAEMSATATLVFYSMFVMSEKPQLVFTIPLVLFGLFRYWYVVEELGGGESPTDALIADWQLLLVVILWLGACCWALWPKG